MKRQSPPFLKIFFLILTSFGLIQNGSSQDDRNGRIVAFHPAVGNSINLLEKKEFQLFTEYNDSLFESAQLVKYSADSYSILVKTISDQSFEKPITIQELDAIYAKIEKEKSTKTVVDDYVEKKPPKEEQKRANRSESAYMIAEITLQIVFVFLEILALSY